VSTITNFDTAIEVRDLILSTISLLCRGITPNQIPERTELNTIDELRRRMSCWETAILDTSKWLLMASIEKKNFSLDHENGKNRGASLYSV